MNLVLINIVSAIMIVNLWKLVAVLVHEIRGVSLITHGFTFALWFIKAATNCSHEYEKEQYFITSYFHIKG